jgi:hypothetical protein
MPVSQEIYGTLQGLNLCGSPYGIIIIPSGFKSRKADIVIETSTGKSQHNPETVTW